MGLRIVARLCLGLLGGLALVNCAAAQGLTKLTMAITSPSIPASTARIVKELGIFQKHGLDVAITVMESGSVATMSLISGSTNFAISAPTDVVIAQARGQNLVALTTAYHGNSAVLVLSKATVEKLGVAPTAPVSERFKALNGLVIATPSATSTYTVGVKGAAEAVGAKINFAHLAQPAMIAALQTGAIQGFVSGAPFYAQPVLNNTGVIWFDGPKGEIPPQYTPSNVIVVMAQRDYAAAHLDLVKRVVDSFLDFGKTATERPADVRAALGRLYPEIDPKLLDLLFESELNGFKVGMLTAEEMAHDIEFTRSTGSDLSRLNGVNPSTLMFP
jgi:ABC-type nitrate/sulfonate/bicarbonate transport system substrate-binding protein